MAVAYYKKRLLRKRTRPITDEPSTSRCFREFHIVFIILYYNQNRMPEPSEYIDRRMRNLVVFLSPLKTINLVGFEPASNGCDIDATR